MSTEIVYFVFAPPYNENIGGYIALHKLCDLINQQGKPCFLVPLFNNNEISVLNWQASLRQTLAQLNHYENMCRDPERFYPRNPNFNTPIFKGNINDISKYKNAVVIYPEIINGNPLNAKNVARWLLHDPGFHSGKIHFSKGEVQFRYSDYFDPVITRNIETAPNILNLIDIPWALYQENDKTIERKGTAYAVRKGKGKKLVHDLNDSICIDGKSHSEIAHIFKHIKTFISYDTETFYSSLAVVSGAISVVIPDSDTITSEVRQTRPIENGIAYGFDDIPRAMSTKQMLIDKLKKMESDSKTNVSEFIEFWENRLKILIR
jgi:hypothetical protein